MSGADVKMYIEKAAHLRCFFYFMEMVFCKIKMLRKDHIMKKQQSAADEKYCKAEFFLYGISKTVSRATFFE